jgi:hypothetical protein
MGRRNAGKPALDQCAVHHRLDRGMRFACDSRKVNACATVVVFSYELATLRIEATSTRLAFRVVLHLETQRPLGERLHQLVQPPIWSMAAPASVPDSSWSSIA